MHATLCVASSRRRCIKCGLVLCADPEPEPEPESEAAVAGEEEEEEGVGKNEECSTSTRSIRRCMLYVRHRPRANSVNATSRESARAAADRRERDVQQMVYMRSSCASIASDAVYFIALYCIVFDRLQTGMGERFGDAKFGSVRFGSGCNEMRT